MIRRIVRGGLTGFVLCLAIAAYRSQATTFPQLTTEQTTDLATWIVEGEVVRVWTELDPDRPERVWSRAEVEIDAVLKGPGTPDTLIIDSLGGRVGDVWMHVPGSAVFSVGERIFTFLSPVDHGRRLVPVSMFLGKLTIRRAGAARERHVMRFARSPDPDAVYDHRFLPHPVPEHRQPYDDLRRRVEARLTEGWDGSPIPGVSLERLLEINGEPRTSARVPSDLEIVP